MKFYSFVFVVSALACCVGCGDRSGGMPKTFPATATITMGGAPLEGATVNVVPVDEANAKWSGAGNGPTDETGKVVFYSYGREGLIDGEFAVTVVKADVTPNPNDDTGALDEYKHYVDANYWKETTTPLRIKVSSKDKNEFTLDVEKFNPETFNATPEVPAPAL